MDKTVNIFEQIIKSGSVVIVGIGLLFILIAIVVGVFKQTWFIAGVNTMSKKEKEKMDLEYLAKYFGLFFGIFGGIMILSVFICTYLGIMNYFYRSMPIAILAFCAFLILYFNVFKRKRIYNKKDTDQAQPIDVPAKKWRKLLPIAIVAVTFVLLFFAGKEPRVVFVADAFKMKGIYGVNIPFAEIAEIDTISRSKMPAISTRTNGISIFKIHRGWYKTAGGDKIRLSINSGSSPIIRIAERNGAVYYINRKNPAETRQIFNKLNFNN